MSRHSVQPRKNRLALRRLRGRSRSPDTRRACLFEALEGRCLFSAAPALQTLLEVAEPTESGGQIPTEEITLAYTKAEWSHPAGTSEFAQAVPTTLPGALPQAVLEVAEPAESGALIPTEETTLNFTPVEWHPVGGVTGDALGEGGPVTENLPMAAEDIIWLVPQYNPYDQVDGGAPSCEITPLRAGTPEGASLPMMPGGEHATIDRAGADSTGARRVVRPPEPEPRPVFKGEIAYVEPTFLRGSSLAGLARDPARALTADERPIIEYDSGNVLDDTSARSTDLTGDIGPAADRAIVEMVGLATIDRTGDGGIDDASPNLEPLFGWDDWLEWLWPD